MKVVFTSKDPLIQKFYEDTFGEQFSKSVEEAEEAARQIPNWGQVQVGDKTYSWRDVLLQMFTAQMLKEAERQEHYNYEVIDGKRQVIYVESDNAFVPQLLIPQVEIL